MTAITAPSAKAPIALCRWPSRRGADEAVLIEGEPGELLSSRWLAEAVVALARERGTEVILSGVQTGEDLFGQFAPYAGAMLDWPHVSGASRIAWVSGSPCMSPRARRSGVTANYRVRLLHRCPRRSDPQRRCAALRIGEQTA